MKIILSESDRKLIRAFLEDDETVFDAERDPMIDALRRLYVQLIDDD